jgi:hypothetical protein
MNRRGFLKSLGTLAAGFAILPAATTYGRRWKIAANGFSVPAAGLLKSASCDELGGVLSTDLTLMWNLKFLEKELHIIDVIPEEGTIDVFRTIKLKRFVDPKRFKQNLFKDTVVMTTQNL